jgi:L-Ala-D/L-Glu epimerase
MSAITMPSSTPSVSARRLFVAIERWPIAGTFTIARGSRTEAVVVRVSIEEDRAAGQGECVPYARYGETPESVVAEIDEMRSAIEGGTPASVLQRMMKPGAARNAVDCALWDLEAKRSGIPVWRRAGLAEPRPLITAYTISVGAPADMAIAALQASSRPLLKVKLAGDGDAERIAAVREAVPKAVLIADANESWSEANAETNMTAMAKAGVKLVEQPLPAAKDEALRHMHRPVPICADESVHDRPSLHRLTGLYDAVNIKLDKTGGLTEALALLAEARGHGFKIMIGCMVGTSLAMAPAQMLAGEADYVDLDGPLLLAKDREHGLIYEGGTVNPPDGALWG